MSTIASPRGNAQQLAKLSPAQRQYVTDNLGELLDNGIRLDVSTPSGNGHEPVLTLQDERLHQMLADNPTQTFNVQTHYHGDIWPDKPEFWDKSTIVDAMKRLWQKDVTSVFVLPQTQVFGAATGTTPVGGQQGYTAWNNVSDEKQTTDESLASAGLDPLRANQRTVSGHSSGGYPLSRVMASTASSPGHPTIDASRILILDTVKGNLSNAQVPEWWRDHHPNTITYVDAVMHSFTQQQAHDYGWNYLVANDHFDAVKRFFDYGR